MTWKFFITLIAIYYLYKLVFNVIIPVTKVANNVKKNIAKMQQQQQEQDNLKQNETIYSQKQSYKNNNDYIDFEEIK